MNAGSAFVVTITTWGGGCTSFARTEVELSETEVVVVPFDRTRIPGENEKCTQFLRPIPHPTTLVFELPGDKLIRIRGLDHERASEPLEVTRTIAVQ